MSNVRYWALAAVPFPTEFIADVAVIQLDGFRYRAFIEAQIYLIFGSIGEYLFAAGHSDILRRQDIPPNLIVLDDIADMLIFTEGQLPVPKPKRATAGIGIDAIGRAER